MSIPVIDVRNKGEKIEDLPPEMQRFFYFLRKKCMIWDDLGRFGTILYDLERFGTIDML